MRPQELATSVETNSGWPVSGQVANGQVSSMNSGQTIRRPDIPDAAVLLALVGGRLPMRLIDVGFADLRLLHGHRIQHHVPDCSSICGVSSGRRLDLRPRPGRWV